MDQKTDRLYRSAPLEEKIDLKQRVEKKLIDVNSFIKHTNNIKKMITFCEDKHYKLKKKYKNDRNLNTVLESADSIIIIGATSTSITSSIIGIGLIISPNSACIACTLSLRNKLFISCS